MKPDWPPRRLIRLQVLLTALAATAGSMNAVRADDAPARLASTLQDIPAGTAVVDAQANRWNRLLLVTTPILASGETGKVPAYIRNAVPRFSSAILATVASSPSMGGSAPSGASPSPAYVLAEVGIGCSMNLGGRETIVTPDEAEALGADLGFIERQILDRFAARLQERKVVVRTPDMMIFDAPAILAAKDGHRDETVRYFIWIDANTGATALAMWLIDGESSAVRDAPIQFIAGGATVEQRLHVDGAEFTFGMPTERAFGIEQLPQGSAVPWTDSLKQLAGMKAYSDESLTAFVKAFGDALAASR